jgi:hypothetical protein
VSLSKIYFKPFHCIRRVDAWFHRGMIQISMKIGQFL